MTRLRVVTLMIGITCALAGAVAFGRVQTDPKKAYVLVQVDVTNPTQYGEYAKLAPAVVAKYGGRYLARAGRTVTLEGPPAKARVVVLEFPTFERAQEFYQSAEYRAARKLRQGAADAQWIVVEGQ